MKDKIAKFREYLDYIERHYDNVQLAWQLLNDKCSSKGFIWRRDDKLWYQIDQRVKVHDLSKLSAEEFTQYRQVFFATDDEIKDRDVFERAWEHHKLENDHHWENWTSKYWERSDKGIVCLIENIIDWIAMSMEFGDTAKEYYERNIERIKLPNWAIKEMYDIFDCIYND